MVPVPRELPAGAVIYLAQGRRRLLPHWDWLGGGHLAHLCGLPTSVCSSVWIHLPREEAHRRRMTTKPVSETYFNEWLWPNHQSYEYIALRGRPKHLRPKVFDGQTPSHSLVLALMKYLEEEKIIPPGSFRVPSCRVALC